MASLKNCGFVAIDGLDTLQARSLIQKLEGKVLGAKFTDLLDQDACQMLMYARMAGFVAWADAKYSDVPKTVANRVSRMVSYGANYVSVHASGGSEMVKAAAEAYNAMCGTAEQEGGILAVTILTSWDEADCQRVYGRGVEEMVHQLSTDSIAVGAAGVICSPLELKLFSNARFKVVNPGIVSEGYASRGHKRYASAHFARTNGAHRLVIGGEIVNAPDPLEAIRRIDESIAHLS